MIESPTPQHGFFAVQVAICVCLAAVIGIVLGLQASGAPVEAVGVAFVVVAAVLLVPFWSVSRRLHPSH